MLKKSMVWRCLCVMKRIRYVIVKCFLMFIYMEEYNRKADCLWCVFTVTIRWVCSCWSLFLSINSVQHPGVISTEIHRLKSLEKVPKHTSHSNQQNHQIWSRESSYLIQIGWTIIKWQDLPKCKKGNYYAVTATCHDDIPALPHYWSTGAVFWEFGGASGIWWRIAFLKFLKVTSYRFQRR